MTTNAVKVMCLAAVAVLAAGCKTSGTAEGVPAASAAAAAVPQGADITEKYWKLTELNGQPVVMSEQMRREPHLILKAEGRRVNAHGGCNSFSGTYTITAPLRIRFSPMAGTMMACLDMETEAAMRKMFEQVDNYSLSADGKTLSLSRARMAPLARFEQKVF